MIILRKNIIFCSVLTYLSNKDKNCPLIYQLIILIIMSRKYDFQIYIGYRFINYIIFYYIILYYIDYILLHYIILYYIILRSMRIH